MALEVILAGIFVIVFVCLIFVFSIREGSFEQAIEDQKRRTLEEEQQKSEKNKKEKKVRKFSKKSKEKSENGNEIPVDQPKDEGQSQCHIEIIEPQEFKPKQKKGKSSGDLANKESRKQKVNGVNLKSAPEKVISAEIKEVNENVLVKTKVIEVEKPKVKVIEAEKLVQANVIETGKLEQVKVVESEKIEIPALSETEASVEKNVPSMTTSSSHAKKKKKEQSVKDAAGCLSANKLLSLIKDAELDSEESQMLIDILLNKQKDSASWKQTSTHGSKKLHDKTHLLEQEKQNNQSLLAKYKELKDECQSLKTKLANQEKINQEKTTQHHQEIQSLSVRVKNINDQLTAEREKFSQAHKSADDKLQVSFKKYDEEKKSLQQTISQLETEALSGASKTELESLRKSRDEIQKVHKLLVDQHTQLVTSHKSDIKKLNSQLTEVKMQFEKVNAEHGSLLKEIKVLREKNAALTSSKQSLEQQLKKETSDNQVNYLQEKLEEEKKRSDDLETKVNEMIDQIEGLVTELQNLQSENDKFSEQLISTKERIAGDGQEIIPCNDELSKKEEMHLKSSAEKDKLLQEKEFLLTELQDELNKQKLELVDLSKELELQKEKNNELREKNWTAIEALKESESTKQQRIAEVQIAADAQISRLKEDCEKLRQSSSVSHANSTSYLEKIKKLEDLTTKQSSEYSKEIEKSKSSSAELERITDLHKSSESRLHEVSKDVEDLISQLSKSQSKAKAYLQRIFPEIIVAETLPYETWLEQFVEKASVQQSVSKSEYGKLQETVTVHEKEARENESKLQNYEKILGETESTLQRLQDNAERQESVWQERFSQKEEELKGAISRRDVLIEENNKLESKLQNMSQLEEVNKNCINLKDQLENKEKIIIELQKESQDIDVLRKEIKELKSKLDDEKRISKAFSSDMIRLNSLVKIGQDALGAEQERVKSLQNQLDLVQSATANGNSNISSSCAPPSKESQPKTKSSEKLKKKTDASIKK